jgi:glucosylceramidase
MTEKQKMLHLPFLFLLLALASRLDAQTPAHASIRLTHPAGTARWERQPDIPLSASAPSTGRNERIDIDPGTRFQSMEGFGFTLTGGSAQLLRRMSPPARAQLLRELFATDGTNIGVSFLRISVGASDLNDRVFTYNDLPKGQTDPEMKRFSLDPDRADLLPVLQEILRIQPTLKIMASPWTAPSWMKTESPSSGPVPRATSPATFPGTSSTSSSGPPDTGAAPSSNGTSPPIPTTVPTPIAADANVASVR